MVSNQAGAKAPILPARGAAGRLADAAFRLRPPGSPAVVVAATAFVLEASAIQQGASSLRFDSLMVFIFAFVSGNA